jgi:nitrite reductase/ring-hydroxylating ferredoxin subunit
MADRHVVATVDEIPPGGRKRVTVKGRDIALFNVKGEFFALLDRCPHEGASLCAGKIVGLAESDGPGHYRLVRQGEMLRCPWHGWQYDIRTGQSWCDPDNIKLRNYPVTVEPGEKVAKGPYVVETFAVSVDKEYVVLEL